MNKYSRIKLNMPVIIKMNSAKKIALEKTAVALKTEVLKAQVMPFDTGTMQNDDTDVDNSKSNKGISKLITSSPQARRLYYHPEYNFQTTNNPNAKGNWYDDWISGDKKDFCSKAFAKFYKKEAGL
ncbi:MAG: hypothetical protein SOZ71_04560 [Clostridium sp.]|nr:hypothetical protein [Clostridium sp.]